jgi:iron complex outermembrane receptor protein
MKKYSLFFLLAVSCAYNFYAQKDTIVNTLTEVKLVTKKRLKTQVLGIKSVTITDNQIVKNPVSLTNLLRYNSPIAFRDYGNGGVSTARFRGTSPTNTSVLWNGIPINAVGNGQTDFNALSANTSDEIVINSGGGSVDYGSGAIGGVVHLNDVLEFKKTKQFQVFSSFGSFLTISNFFKSFLANEKWSTKFSATYNSSRNDYEYIDGRFRDNDGDLFINENGSFKNYNLNLTTGYQFSTKNKLQFFTTKYYGNRFFSDGLPNPSAATERNEDFNQRNLLKWQLKYNRFKQEINVAYLTQEFRYYNDKDAVLFDFGKSTDKRFDYNLNYRFSNQLNISLGFIYDDILGTTKTQLSEHIENRRTSTSFLGSIDYNPTEKIQTNISVRNEQNSDFNVPLAWSVTSEFTFSKKLNVSLNLSSNYRVPTFNELYWPQVGNLNLVPENSIQGELGVSFNNDFISISSTFFYINIDDKILWLPTLGSNLWRPINVENTIHKGFEVFVNLQKKLGNHQFTFSSNYTFAGAKDSATGSFLPFAPQHLLNFNLDYFYKKLHFYIQNLYQSKVFTNPINIDFYALDALSVFNIGSEYVILKTDHKDLSIGLKVNNIFNELYYFSNLRPMPGTNFNIHINYKF